VGALNSKTKRLFENCHCTSRYYYTCRRGRRGRDRMAVGFITTYAISTYRHQRCEFELRSDEVYLMQHFVIKFASDLRQVGGFPRVLRFPPAIKLTATI
jgi:hypothetical protein